MTPETILSKLRDHLREEQGITTIEDLDKNLITQAQDRIKKIENIVIAKSEGVEERLILADERESIIETLHKLHQLREDKLTALAKYPDILTPVNRLLRTDRR